MNRDEITAELFCLQDKKYAAFQAKLIPTVEACRIIGVRTPELRSFAKRLFKDEDTVSFLKCLPHQYFDENQLHAFVISLEKDFYKCIAEVEAIHGSDRIGFIPSDLRAVCLWSISWARGFIPDMRTWQQRSRGGRHQLGVQRRPRQRRGTPPGDWVGPSIQKSFCDHS